MLTGPVPPGVLSPGYRCPRVPSRLPRGQTPQCWQCRRAAVAGGTQVTGPAPRQGWGRAGRAQPWQCRREGAVTQPSKVGQAARGLRDAPALLGFPPARIDLLWIP